MKEYLNSLKTIWLLTFIASILALVVVCLYIFSPIANIGFKKEFVQYAYAIQLITVVVSLFINKRHSRHLQKIKEKDSLNEKLSAYKNLYKRTLAFSVLLFAASSVVLLFTNSAEFLVIPIALLLLLFLKRPYLIKLKLELSLSDKDVNI